MLRTAIAAAGCAALVLAGVSAGAVTATPQAGSLSIQVWLKPDWDSASRFAAAVSRPGSPEFHHYLGPDAYTARFGPSTATAQAVSDWLTAGGLEAEVSAGRDYVAASGPASTVQSVVGVQGDTRPASLAQAIMGVTGLGTSHASAAQTSRPAQPTCSSYWAQHVVPVHPSYRGLTRASLPICGYSARQLRAAYGASWAFTGKGQTVALTESAAPTAMFQTLTEYAKRNHLPAPTPSQYRETQAGGDANCGPRARSADRYNDEAEMDSEAVYAMAPHADQLMVVGIGCDEDQALLNATLSVLIGDGHRPSASIISNSWQIPIGDVTPQTIHAITVRAAAEGVGLYFASGDTPGLTTTASDPLVTAVGGTTLGLGAGNTRVFETSWSNDTAVLEDGEWSDLGVSGAGGGTSLTYPQPAYQKGVVPASMSHVKVGGRTAVNRAVPDIAAVGNLSTGMLTGYTASDNTYRTMVNAGTSLSAPLVAALVADAQQGRRSTFGFINPLIYRLHGTPAFHDILPVTATTPKQNRATYTPASNTDSASIDVFDSQNPTDTNQITAKGYDTITGVGTPNGLPFILGLRLAAG
ncbi:protease pro-enzyme activation domain-containing protein [Kribbella sp. NPDC004875]|uniref:S53 family peptidase n=1 Tax=Kribbella sp. NPDC004875 TaxID=3364107 RepID=UPI00367F8AA7